MHNRKTISWDTLYLGVIFVLAIGSIPLPASASDTPALTGNPNRKVVYRTVQYDGMELLP